VDGHIVCKQCFTKKAVTCCICENPFFWSGSRVSGFYNRDDTAHHFCNTCLEERLGTCTLCQNTMEKEKGKVDKVTNAFYCLACWEKETGGRQRPRYLGNGKLYFGAEIEVEAPENLDRIPYYERLAKDGEGRLIIKGDGSLNYGIEIVTHPFSFEWALQNSDKFDHIWKLRDEGFKAGETSSCGLHVHMTRSAFTSLHLYKFLKFMMAEERRNYMVTVSQRQGVSYYANFERYQTNDKNLESIALTMARNHTQGYCHERYSAVNLNNRNTIELRLFKGTLNPRTFWKTIEFCHSAYMFTKEISMQELKGQKVIRQYHEYLLKNANLYRNLIAFLVSERLMEGGDKAVYTKHDEAFIPAFKLDIEQPIIQPDVQVEA
jgi:hypothetical protein